MILGILLGGMISGHITHSCTDASWREQIIKHGAAEYYLDQKYHRQWRWIEGPQIIFYGGRIEVGPPAEVAKPREEFDL